MTETFDKLKTLLEQKGCLTDEDITQAVALHGDMKPEEVSWIAAEQHERTRAAGSAITMEQYLEALKVLDTATEGSSEYVKAEKIVATYESAG